MSLGSCCISGVKHEGTPAGEFTTINGARVYQALPKGDYDKSKALLFCTDIFGNSLPNGQLVADAFAAEGFATYAVDYLNGDDAPEDALSGNKDFDLMAWLGKHGKAETYPHIIKTIEGLKQQGVKDFAATGYCFGGRFVVDCVLDGHLKVAIVSHPSLLKPDEDLPAIKAKSIPFLWNTCENDQMWPKECQEKADEVFKGDKNYQRNYYEGVSHGFAIRGDPKDEKSRKAKEGAFESSIKFLKENL
ncbi:BZ3500_MvSof-1268-A1-R1_Chr3-2g06328 [Microbotryum saponariae]|uniref:BZ3500_MvSof-1268-A1-R1_Chr3-2g06328 protein n=1 Tax=Microbotryum saponariae TaxID=289078 RepID=A0A2X0N1D9_9BASI|nr:BZ3500_MvSof-1268-A1-R1_Chr3-2g06328 [Microbotryum saponariae]SDA04299.1 BZ3501_MvSof-1269-A2-R1_Chr3-2g06019 [Microbotryum saponariae]